MIKDGIYQKIKSLINLRLPLSLLLFLNSDSVSDWIWSKIQSPVYLYKRCKSFINRKKGEPLASTNKFNISWQCMYVVFIRQCCVCYMIKHAKRQKNIAIFGCISCRACTSWSAFIQCSLCFTRHKTQFIRRYLVDV